MKVLALTTFLLAFTTYSEGMTTSEFYKMNEQQRLDYYCGRRAKDGGFLDIVKVPKAVLPNKQTKSSFDNAYVETTRDGDNPDFYNEVEREDEERYREDYGNGNGNTTPETPTTSKPDGPVVSDQRRIIIILDETGSMIPQKQLVIKRFNAFLKQLKASNVDSDSILTVVKFDYDIWLLNDHLKDFAKLHAGTYFPDRNGPTALYDTIGCTLNAFKAETNNLLVIISDGVDNASRLFEQSDIKTMNMLVKKNSKWSFDYIYLGDQDAKEFSKKIGITARHASSYDKSPKGIRRAFRKLTKTIQLNWDENK